MSSGITSSRPTTGSATPDTEGQLYVNFSYNPTGAAGTLQFAASAGSNAGAIVAYEWTFGDSSTGIGQIVSHTYAAVATYTVGLTVRDAAGNSKTDSRTVVSPAPAERGTITLDMFTTAGLAAGSFLGIAKASTTAGSISDYSWSSPGVTPITTVDAIQPYNVYVQGGYDGFGSPAPSQRSQGTVTLTARDTTGATRSISKQTFGGEGNRSSQDVNVDARIVFQTVGNAANVALVQRSFGSVLYGVPDNGTVTFGVRPTIDGAFVAGTVQLQSAHLSTGSNGVSFTVSPQSLTFTATSPFQNVTIANIKYDRAITAGLASGISSRSPAIALAVSGTTGGKQTQNNPLIITSALQGYNITATFTASVGSNGLTQFTAIASSTSSNVTAYTWDFGDATSGSGQKLAHTYAVSGTYIVTLTITTAAGETKTVSDSVRVPLVQSAELELRQAQSNLSKLYADTYAIYNVPEGAGATALLNAINWRDLTATSLAIENTAAALGRTATLTISPGNPDLSSTGAGSADIALVLTNAHYDNALVFTDGAYGSPMIPVVIRSVTHSNVIRSLRLNICKNARP